MKHPLDVMMSNWKGLPAAERRKLAKKYGIDPGSSKENRLRMRFPRQGLGNWGQRFYRLISLYSMRT